MFLKSFTFPSPRVALVNLPFLTPPTPMALQSSQAHPGHGVLQLIVALLCFGTFGTGTQTGPCGKLHLADAGASPPPVGSLPHLLWGLVVPPNTRPPVPSTLGASVMPFTLGGPTLPSAQARIHKWSPPVTGAGQGQHLGLSHTHPTGGHGFASPLEGALPHPTLQPKPLDFGRALPGVQEAPASPDAHRGWEGHLCRVRHGAGSLITANCSALAWQRSGIPGFLGWRR